MSMSLNKNMEQYILQSQEELKQLIRDLCAIPAPSHHEEKRAEFCKQWFLKNGGKEVFIDEAFNVICPHRVTESNDLTVIMAHTDTVFPDLEPLPFSEENGIMYAPGITDDTANLAVLMICARYILLNDLPTKTGILFVANSCEEGLGNLKGCRAIAASYGPRMKEFITLDGTDLVSIVARAVGSHRYRITASTDGGHSFRDFGKRNAIHALSALVDRLYEIDIPVDGDSHTTYNVGVFTGGTSVNTIAQNAEMLYEYRSDSQQCLSKMKTILDTTVALCRQGDVELHVEMIGDRPCAGNVDKAAWNDLIKRARTSIRNVTGQEAVCTSGSTDCNIPLSIGVPSICMGVCIGGKCHTREEWLDASSLIDGCRLFMDFFTGYLDLE